MLYLYVYIYVLLFISFWSQGLSIYAIPRCRFYNWCPRHAGSSRDYRKHVRLRSLPSDSDWFMFALAAYNSFQLTWWVSCSRLRHILTHMSTVFLDWSMYWSTWPLLCSNEKEQECVVWSCCMIFLGRIKEREIERETRERER